MVRWIGLLMRNELHSLNDYSDAFRTRKQLGTEETPIHNWAKLAPDICRSQKEWRYEEVIGNAWVTR